jgi:hypothetical protein
VALGSSGTVTNFPPFFVVKSAPPHLSQDVLGEWIGDDVAMLWGRGRALGLGVSVVRISKISSPSSPVVSSCGCRRGLELNALSLFEGGLNEGGDEGAEDSVMVSEKSDVKSGVEGTEDAYESLFRVKDKLEVLKLLLKLGEPCLEVNTGILDGNFCGVGVLDVGDGRRRSGDEDVELVLDANEDEEAACFKNLFFICSTASSVNVGLSVHFGVVLSGLVNLLYNS